MTASGRSVEKAPDLLKRAAALMRERTGNASPGPWDNRDTLAGVQGSTGRCVLCHYGEPVWTGRANINGCPVDAHVHRTGEYPAAALAVADWLDHEARIHMNHSGTELCVFDLPSMADTPAVRVARAYLGEA